MPAPHEPSPQPAQAPQHQSPLQRGNAALRAGDPAAAIRHYALGLLDEAQHRNGPIAAQLAANLVRARQRYRRQSQQQAAATGAGLRVAVACWSLSENPLGRAQVLASLYHSLAEPPIPGAAQRIPQHIPGRSPAPIHSVAVIGSFFARRGRALWPPLRDAFHQGSDPAPGPGAIPLHSILVEDDRHFMAQAIDLVSAHPFDLVHLCKPRMPNILLGLLYRLLWDARILVDIDDDELAFVGGQPLLREGASAGADDSAGSPAEHALAHWLQRYHGLPPGHDLPGRPWTELGMSLATAFDGLSVVNRALQQRHGGVIIRHARDPRQFQPAAAPRARARTHARARARARWHIRPAQQVVIFLGTPRGHKGLLATAQALASLRQPELLYLIVGRFPPGTEALKQALEALHASGALAIRMLDDQPFAAIPELLAAADLAVLLQDPDSAAARVQTPAKLSDALAMGLTVLAEPTPGLADLAEQGAFIPVDRAQLPAQLAAALRGLRPTEAPTDQAHPVFTRELSLAVNRERLHALVDATARRAASPAPLDPALARLAALPALGPLPRALLAADPAARDGVSVIILSLRGAELLERLLGSFRATNSHQPVELIIIDHGDPHDPDDPTAAVIARHRAALDLWHLPRGRNHSFSDSCNLGATLARYPYLLFLNNDILYTADALPPALAQLRDPRHGIVGIRLDDDPSSLPPAQTTGQTPGIQHLGIHFPWSAKRGYHHPRQIRLPSVRDYLAQSPPAVSEQPAVTGAFLLCRKPDFERLGGFSTDYDYGLEDIDLCLRMRQQLGKTSRCLTSIGLQHAESTTRRRDPEGTAARIARNHQHFKQRWGAHTADLAKPHATQPAAHTRAKPGASLNILFVLPGPLDSNNGYHVQHHAAQLRAQGADCRVAVPDANQAPGTDTLPSCTHSQALGRAPAAQFSNGHSPDIIHAWTPRESVRRVVEPLRRATGARLLVHLEDNEEYLTAIALGRPYAELARLQLAELDRCIPGHRYHPSRGQWLLDRADGLTLIASTLARFNRRHLPTQRLPAPVDETLFSPRPLNHSLRQAQGIPAGHCVLAYTGRVHQASHQEVVELYRAVTRLNQHGLPSVLLRTGLNRVDTPMPATPAGAVRELGWVPRAQVPDILAAADILVQPGDPGPFNNQRLPSKLPEYFAMGRPVIMARGHPDLNPRHGEQAWLLDTTTAAQLAEAVRTLWHDRPLAERLASGARWYYEQHLRTEPAALFHFMTRHIQHRDQSTECRDGRYCPAVGE